jgi:hypothetical protein
MSNPNQVYPSSFSAVGYSNSQEINLRQELLNTFSGTGQEIGKAEQGIWRQMQLDSNGNKINCVCVDRETGEQDRDYYCPVCLGEKYMWTESLIQFYRVQHTSDNGGLKSVEIGLRDVVMCVFYILSNVPIGDTDKIVQINLDDDGNIQKPIKRIQVWQLTEVARLRLDNGRVEFKKAFARIDDTRYLNTSDV